jgi:hypothetical protein
MLNIYTGSKYRRAKINPTLAYKELPDAGGYIAEITNSQAE